MGTRRSLCLQAIKGVANVLVHYNTELKLIMTVDASPVGVGAVLSHIIKDGREKPIYFASQVLSKTDGIMPR